MILFCEYVIPERNLEPFRAWVSAHPELWNDAELLENIGQPGVFVELRRVDGEQEAVGKQKERLDGRSEWRTMDTWVKGGRDGLRLWIFRRLIPA